MSNKTDFERKDFMLLVLKIIVGVAVAFAYFYMGTHNGKTIHEKKLTEEEKKYLSIHELWFIISLPIIAVLLFI